MKPTVGRGDRLQHLIDNSHGLGGVALRVAMLLINRSNTTTGVSRRSFAKIATELGVNERTVDRAIKELANRGLLLELGQNGRGFDREICPKAAPGEMLRTGQSTDGQYAENGQSTDGETTGPTPRPPVDRSSDPRSIGPATTGRSTPRVHVQDTELGTSPDGTRSTQDGPGGSTGDAPNGSSSAQAPDRSALEQAIADDTRAFLEQIGMEHIGETPTRFAIEFGPGVDDWPDHTAVLAALWSEAKRQASSGPHGLLLHWLRSRGRWASVLCEALAPHRDGDAALGAKERHRRLRKANSVDVGKPLRFSEVYGE